MGDILKGIYHWIMDNIISNDWLVGKLNFAQNDVSIIQGVWDYFAIVGIGMTLIYFLMEMNRKLALEGGDLNFKSFFSPFLKLVIAIAVLSQAAKIVGWILSFNNTMLTGLQTAVSTGGTGGTEGTEGTTTYLYDPILDKIGFWGGLGMLLPMTGCMLISIVLKVVWSYKVILYKLEVLFRVGITPIACADIYSGANSTAVRYLKGFLVLGIYGASMVILPELSQLLAFTGIENAVDDVNIWGIVMGIVESALIAPFAALTCTNVVKTAAKEALGA